MINKINWGHKITFVIVIFIVAMLSMVFLASMQTNDMLDEQYYEKELQHQRLIDASLKIKQANGNKNVLTLTADSVYISVPASLVNDMRKATLEFINWADKKKDVRQTLKLNTVGIQAIAKNHFAKGNYTMRLYWEANGEAYYCEENFLIK
jgi:hypothetical protein